MVTVARARIVQSYIFKSVLSRTHILITNEAKNRADNRITDIKKNCPGCGSCEIDARGRCYNCKRPRRMLFHKDDLSYYETPFYTESTELFNHMLNYPGHGLRVLYKPKHYDSDPLGTGTVYLGFKGDIISACTTEADYHYEYDVNPKLLEKLAKDLFEYIKERADGAIEWRHEKPQT